MSKSKKEEEIDADALIAEEEAWKAAQAEKRQKAINQLLEQRKALDEKLSKLGYNSAPSATRAPRKASEGEGGARKQRTCPRCGELGHRWNKCPNPPQASWSDDPRSKEG